jgi:hypothetical protein
MAPFFSCPMLKSWRILWSFKRIRALDVTRASHTQRGRGADRGDQGGQADHVLAFSARITAATVLASAPRPTRTLTPSISISIIPETG